ncbi:MAG: hypothetical protein RR565_09575 [Erysipelothrix sp.]
MRRKNKIWIALGIFFLGIFLVVLAIGNLGGDIINSFNRPVIVNSSFTQQEETFNLNNKLEIELSQMNKLDITFTEIDTPKVNVSGELQDFKIIEAQGSTYIKSSNQICANNITFACTEAQIDTMIVSLPLNYDGSISVKSVNGDIAITSDELQSLKAVKIDALHTNTSMKNINTNLEINGAKVTGSFDNVGGNARIDALSADLFLTNPPETSDYNLNALNSSIDIKTTELNYNVDTNGLHNELNDTLHNKVQKNTLTSVHSRYNSSIENTPYIRINIDGLKNSVMIHK